MARQTVLLLSLAVACGAAQHDGHPSPPPGRSTTLRPGDGLTAKVTFEEAKHKGVEFLLCDAVQCSSIVVRGNGHVAATNCTLQGTGCTEEPFVPWCSNVTDAVLNFRVERTASILWIGDPGSRASSLFLSWRENLHAEPKAWVPVQAGSTRLVVRAVSSDNMTVDFFDRDTLLAVGGGLTVNVRYSWPNFGYLVFLHCDLSRCSEVSVRGRTTAGALGYIAKTNCLLNGEECSPHHEIEGEEYLFGLLAFHAQRNATTLFIWEEGRPEEKAWVPVPDGSTTFKVRSGYRWRIAAPAEFSEFSGITNQEFELPLDYE